MKAQGLTIASGSAGTVPVSALTATFATPSIRPAAIPRKGPLARPGTPALPDRKQQRGTDSDCGGLERRHGLD